MGDAENPATSKKRSAGRQISKDDPNLDDDEPELEMGSFKRASNEVLSTRRIVKVRRPQAAPSAPTPNPFANIKLVTSTNDSSTAGPSDVVAQKTEEFDNNNNNNTGGTGETNSNEKNLESGDIGAEDVPAVNGQNCSENFPASIVDDKEKVEVEKCPTFSVKTNEGGKNGGQKINDASEQASGTEEVREQAEKLDEKKPIENAEIVDAEKVEKSEPVVSLSSFQQLSNCQNAFTGLSGTGFAGSSFSFGTGPFPKAGSVAGSVPVFTFGLNSTTSLSTGGFCIGSRREPSTSFSSFASPAGDDAPKSGGTGSPAMPSFQEVPIETGEENESTLFSADAVMYEFLDGGWKERGKGELKLNVPSDSGGGKKASRLVMRARGNYRLILNASLYPDMTLKIMEKKGVTFACINNAGEGAKAGLSTFALKFKDATNAEEFLSMVAEHKRSGVAATAVPKTPDNSPKAVFDD